MDQIKVGTVTAKVEKKPIKGIHIYIKPPEGAVLVTAPTFVSDREIQQFVYSKEQWILEHVEQVKKQSAMTKLRYEDGDTIPIWGKKYRLTVQTDASSRKFSLALFPEPEIGVAVLTVPEGATEAQKEAFFLRWYRQQTEARLAILVPKWMTYTGLTCAGWNVRQYRARWGCCNTRTKELTFHAQLSRYPQRCLEYVIMHELCHTVIPNHGKEFHALESKYMPEWKQIRKELNLSLIHI